MAQDKVTCEKCGGTGRITACLEGKDSCGFIIPVPVEGPCEPCGSSGLRPITVEDLLECWLASANLDGAMTEDAEIRAFNKWLSKRYGIKEEK
jgi:hypothetical protein